MDIFPMAYYGPIDHSLCPAHICYFFPPLPSFPFVHSRQQFAALIVADVSLKSGVSFVAFAEVK